MKKVGGLFTCSALALMAFAALPLAAAELAHRWSFNGDYSDSAGGADAVKCGTYVSLYGGRVHMGYGECSHGTGYVDLGKNILDTTAATIEIWARHDGVKSWSRVFDYGADSANNVFLSWTFGTTLSKNQVGSKVKGAESKIDYQEPYEIGRDYHIAATFEKQADGITPTTGVDYTFRFVFDYAAQIYSVAVQCGAEWKPLVGRVIPNAPSFPLATSASAVSGVRFTGDGVFTSLLGEYENALSGFRILIR